MLEGLGTSSQMSQGLQIWNQCWPTRALESKAFSPSVADIICRAGMNELYRFLRECHLMWSSIVYLSCYYCCCNFIASLSTVITQASLTQLSKVTSPVRTWRAVWRQSRAHFGDKGGWSESYESVEYSQGNLCWWLRDDRTQWVSSERASAQSPVVHHT